MNQVEFLKSFFLFFLMAKVIFQFYLSLRNRNYILKNKKSVPAKFAAKISLADHQKAASYSVEKSSFGRFSLIIDTIILYFFTVGGFISTINDFFLTQTNEYWAGILVFLVIGTLSFILHLPFGLYSTFVIEEKYGFNKMSPKLYLKDSFKQILLGLLIGGPIVMVILKLMHSLPASWWLWGWLVYTAFQFFLLWIYPTWIAPLFNKFTPLEAGEMKQTIDDLCHRVQFENAGLLVMDASIRSGHGNAFFTGFGKYKRIVFFDTLLKTLSPKEVAAVLAHELGHFKCKHIVKNLLKSILLSLLGFWLLGWLAKSPLFYQMHGVQTPTPAMALLLFSMVSGIYLFFLTPVFAWTSRKYEYEADVFAAKNARAEDLISALVKMYKDNASTLTPDPLFTAFYHSHPPALDRVKHLESLQKAPAPS